MYTLRVCVFLRKYRHERMSCVLYVCVYAVHMLTLPPDEWVVIQDRANKGEHLSRNFNFMSVPMTYIIQQIPPVEQWDNYTKSRDQSSN